MATDGELAAQVERINRRLAKQDLATGLLFALLATRDRGLADGAVASLRAVAESQTDSVTAELLGEIEEDWRARLPTDRSQP